MYHDLHNKLMTEQEHELDYENMRRGLITRSRFGLVTVALIFLSIVLLGEITAIVTGFFPIPIDKTKVHSKDATK